MKIYLYRHGETRYNDKGIVQGRGVDSSLNEKGKKQAAAFFEQYKNIPFDLLLTSTLKRTQETARAFEQSGIPTERSSNLDEIGWGYFEGKPANESMRAVYLGLLNDWKNGHYHHKIEGGGDSALDMQGRLIQFTNYIKTLAGENLLVCTHGGCLAFLMAILQNQPLSAMPNYKHHNTGLCVFEYHTSEDKFELLLQDDISHLAILTK